MTASLDDAQPTEADWVAIVDTAKAQAKEGDSAARQWLTKTFGFGVARRNRPAYPIEAKEEKRMRLLRLAEARDAGGASKAG